MTPEQQSTGVLRFFSNHPVLGLIGSIASIIALPLGVYFFFASQQHRDLVFAENPVRTVLVEAGRPSDLKVEFKGQVLDSVDVVAVQIAIWNEGKASIKPEHVLAPLEIRLDPPAEILSVSPGKHSRAVTGFRTSDAPDLWKQGRVPFSFRILEGNDGGALQLVFAGRRDAGVGVAGTVEGQGSPRRLDVNPLRRMRGTSPLVFVGIIVLVGFAAGFSHAALLKWLGFPSKFTLLSMISILVITVVFTFLARWYWRPGPPFGFE